MIYILALMTSISFTMRVFPLLFSKWLQKMTLLKKLALIFPSCIGILLVAHTLEKVSFLQFPFGLPQIAGLLGVVIMQISFRNILVSMLTGMLLQFTCTYLMS